MNLIFETTPEAGTADYIQSGIRHELGRYYRWGLRSSTNDRLELAWDMLYAAGRVLFAGQDDWALKAHVLADENDVVLADVLLYCEPHWALTGAEVLAACRVEMEVAV